MTNVTWVKSPKTKATLTIQTSDGFEIKECKLIDGQDGLFVVPPSKECKPYVNKKGDTVRFDDVVWIPLTVRNELNDQASQMYDVAHPPYKPYGMQQTAQAVSTNPTPATVDLGDSLPF